jgi:hypothetical protein
MISQGVATSCANAPTASGALNSTGYGEINWKAIMLSGMDGKLASGFTTSSTRPEIPKNSIMLAGFPGSPSQALPTGKSIRSSRGRSILLRASFSDFKTKLAVGSR